MRIRSILTMLVAGALWVVVPASRVAAQAELPPDIVTATALTPEQVAIVEKYINERLPGLSNSDPAKVKTARDELLRGFKNPNVTVSFRRTFSDKMIAELKKMADGKDLVAVNALRIAGEVATSDTSTLLEERLADKRIAVKFAAVRGLGHTMLAVGSHGPAITPERVDALIGKLGGVIQETGVSPVVADAATRSLIEAMGITQQGFPNVRAAAFRTLCESMSKQAQAGVGGPMAPVLLRAGQAAQAALAENGPPLALTGDSLKQAAGLGGQLVGWAFGQVKSGKLPTAAADDPVEVAAARREARKTASQIVNVSENVIILSQRHAGGETIGAANLGTDLEKGDDKAFITKLWSIINPLHGPPFNFPQDTFLKGK